MVNECTDYLEGRIATEPYPFQVCFPAHPEGALKALFGFLPARHSPSYFTAITAAWMKLLQDNND